MIVAKVTPGVCNLATTIEVESVDGMNVTIKIESDCPQIQALAAELTEANAFQEVMRPIRQSQVLELAAAHRLHTTCLVPLGALKAMEAAVGLALPAEAAVRLERVE
jgi:hypothetical protein